MADPGMAIDVTELTTRLDDREALEDHVQAAYIDDVLANEDDPSVSLAYHGSDDINVGSEDIPDDIFSLDGYQVRSNGFGTYTVTVRGHHRALLPGVNCEYGPGGHRIEAYVSRLVYKATATVGVNGAYVDATVFVVPDE